MKLNANAKWMRILGGAGLAVLLLATLAWASNEAGIAGEAAKQMAEATGTFSSLPWWAWPAILLVFCFVLGIIAVLAGVGGGVLFVPLVSGFFPFHLDFVRGAGLLVALAGALAAGPGLLKRNLASLRLALPVALIASSCAIVGAFLGLALPGNVVQICLGGTIMGIAILLLTSKNTARPVVTKQDALGLALGIQGAYMEPTAKSLNGRPTAPCRASCSSSSSASWPACSAWGQVGPTSRF